MDSFYLEQVTIAYSTQIILILVVSGYLLTLKNKTITTKLLIAFSFSLALGISLNLLKQIIVLKEFSTFPLYISCLKNLVDGIGIVTSLQFAYYFPHPSPPQQRERNITLWTSILLSLAGLGVALYQTYYFNEDHLMPPSNNLTLMIALEWIVLVSLRRTIHFSREYYQTLSKISPPWWQLILKPPDQAALASRNLSLVFIAFSLDIIIYLILSYLILIDLATLMAFLALLFLFFALIIVYFNHTRESSTLLIKIMGAALMTTLAVLGVISWLVGLSIQTNYHHPYFITSRQTIHFEPNKQAGYDITAIPFQFDANKGKELEIELFDIVVDLPFTFTFYGRPWQTLYISRDGFVTFGESFSVPIGFIMGAQPMIAVFPADFRENQSKNVFIKHEADKSTITWSHLVALGANTPNTFQLVLYANGSFDFVYNTIDSNISYNTISLFNAPYLIGIISGNPTLGRNNISFTQLPYPNKNGQSAVQNYYVDFRNYMHTQMLPFGYTVIGSTLFILFGFPLFFRTSLVNPLNILVQGMKEVKKGNLDVELPIQTHDEIGFLTASFNDMVKSIKKSGKLQQKLVAIEQELVIAQTIQQSLLPLEKPSWAGLDITSYSHAAHDVGGDFYTYYAFEGNTPLASPPTTAKYAIAVGDISGKGTPAALLMAVSLASFQAIVKQEFAPALLLAQLDTVIMQYTKSNHQNCALCYVELEVGPSEIPPHAAAKLRVANAGCIPPYIKRVDGSITWPEVGGFALGQGLGAKLGYQEITLDLFKGDMVILTSDGVVEAMNESREFLGFDRLEQIVRAAPLTTTTIMLEYLKQSILTFTGQAAQHDDITIVVVQI